jgi:broad specificity phosphatase PhoE
MVLKNPSQYNLGKTIVYFIRHGERIHISGEKEPHDFSLTKKGISQANRVAKELYKIKKEIDFLYSSPMKRAKETAKIISKKIQKTPIILEGFEEVSNTLHTPKYLSLKYWKEFQKFKKKEKTFNKILEDNKGKVIVIVSHGTLSRMLIERKLHLPLKKINLIHTENCHIHCIRFNKKEIDRIYCLNNKTLHF